ncbi:MAG: TolC family protein [Elusimicrobia bacterium]|nr:TolC family protein [Elusimicrobiota bacterium]
MRYHKITRLLRAMAVMLFFSPLGIYAQEAAPLSFDEAARLLLQNNPQAITAERAIDSARNRSLYYRAGLYPQLSANAGYNRVEGDLSPASESYSYGFSATQPIFSPALPAAIRSALASYRKTEADYDLLKSALLFDLKTTFSDLIKARETLKLSEVTLKRRAENVEIIRIKYEAGRENKAALLETQSVYKTSQWQHEGYKKDLRLLERKLNRLLGRPPMADTQVTALPSSPVPPEEFNSFSGSLEKHPSLRSARALLEVSQAGVDRSKSGFLPEADAVGNYTWAGSDWPDKNKSWSAGFTLSLPLFTGGKLSADLTSAQADKARAEASLKDARDEVYINAEDTFLSWRQAWSFMDVANTVLESANARAWLLRKQYLAGQASYFEWRNVEEQLISAENQLLSAKRDLAVAHAAFTRSLGEF